MAKGVIGRRSAAVAAFEQRPEMFPSSSGPIQQLCKRHLQVNQQDRLGQPLIDLVHAQ